MAKFTLKLMGEKVEIRYKKQVQNFKDMTNRRNFI